MRLRIYYYIVEVSTMAALCLPCCRAWSLHVRSHSHSSGPLAARYRYRYRYSRWTPRHQRESHLSLTRLFSSTHNNLTESADIDSDIATSTIPEKNQTKIIPFSESPYQQKKESRYNVARDKRRKLIGLAKAMDHGQPGMVTYQLPVMSSSDRRQYVAASGLPNRTRPFLVLGIESSCDDTGAAIVRSDGVILGEALASQSDIHEPFGGVVPGLARDAHVEAMDRILHLAVTRAGLQSVQEVDAIGATVGPGLEICLRVGATKARQLALLYQKPFVGVHHLEAHILMARLPTSNNNNDNNNNLVVTPATDHVHEMTRTMEFPFLALLVSGGHCQILKCLDIGKYSILGGTLDDSLGEAYDKVARLLGLPVGGGGGPAVEALALKGNPTAIPLPLPLRHRHKDCDFSFAGLKTAVRRAAELKTMGDGDNQEVLSEEDKADIAASFQHVAIQHIEQRLERAMRRVEKEEEEEDGSLLPKRNVKRIRSLAVVGGVAANQELRSRLEALCVRCSINKKEEDHWKMVVPPPRLCTDQGSMSAWAAIERIMVGSTDDPTNDKVYARYPFSLEHEATTIQSDK
jgi:N6-L-threonylcarbamoyladenine synthase